VLDVHYDVRMKYRKQGIYGSACPKYLAATFPEPDT
jgi:hypothetical protein